MEIFARFSFICLHFQKTIRTTQQQTRTITTSSFTIDFLPQNPRAFFPSRFLAMARARATLWEPLLYFGHLKQEDQNSTRDRTRNSPGTSSATPASIQSARIPGFASRDRTWARSSEMTHRGYVSVLSNFGKWSFSNGSWGRFRWTSERVWYIEIEALSRAKKDKLMVGWYKIACQVVPGFQFVDAFRIR